MLGTKRFKHCEKESIWAMGVFFSILKLVLKKNVLFNIFSQSLKMYYNRIKANFMCSDPLREKNE